MYTIGIDLGGPNIVASVVDDDYNIIGTSKTPTNSPRSADEIFDDIADVCEEAVKTAGFFVFRTMKIMKASEDKVSAHKNIGISDCCS